MIRIRDYVVTLQQPQQDDSKVSYQKIILGETLADFIIALQYCKFNISVHLCFCRHKLQQPRDNLVKAFGMLRGNLSQYSYQYFLGPHHFCKCLATDFEAVQCVCLHIHTHTHKQQLGNAFATCSLTLQYKELIVLLNIASFHLFYVIDMQNHVISACLNDFFDVELCVCRQ